MFRQKLRLNQRDRQTRDFCSQKINAFDKFERMKPQLHRRVWQSQSPPVWMESRFYTLTSFHNFIGITFRERRRFWKTLNPSLADVEFVRAEVLAMCDWTCGIQISSGRDSYRFNRRVRTDTVPSVEICSIERGFRKREEMKSGSREASLAPKEKCLTPKTTTMTAHRWTFACGELFWAN